MGSDVPPSYQNELNGLLAGYRAALEVDPQDSQVLVDMAKVQLKLDQVDDAMGSLTRAAWVCFNKEDYTEAVAICGRVFRVRPVDTEARQLIDEIRQSKLLDAEAIEAALRRGRSRRVSDGQQVVVLPRQEPHGGPARPWREETVKRSLPGLGAGPTDPTREEIDLPDEAPRLQDLRHQILTGGQEHGSEPAKPPWMRDTEPAPGKQKPREAPGRDEDADLDPHDPEEGPTSVSSPRAPMLELPIPAELAGEAPRRWYPAGATILEERSKCRELMMIERGQVTLVKGGSELETLVRGDIIGELALLGDGRAHVVCRVLEDATLLVFEEDLLEQMLRSPQTSTLVRKSYRDRLQQMLLHLSPLLRALGQADAQLLLRKCRPLRLNDQQVLVRQGDPPLGLYFVLLGRLIVAEESAVLEQLVDGALFGETSLLQDSPARQTVTAHGFCQLVQLPASDLFRFVESRPDVVELLQRLSVEREQLYQAVREGRAPAPS